MRYPVVIHTDDNKSFGVIVPDVPGCFSAGDSIEDAIANVEDAIHEHLEILAEEGEYPQVPSPINVLQDNPDYVDGVWAFANIDTTAYMGKTEKVTITLPSLLVKRVDSFVKNAKNPGAKNRSQFLAESAARCLGSA